MTQAIVTLASEYSRYGYRRITALLRISGWRVGKDRVQRTWRREGLKVPKKQRPRDVCGLTTVRASDSGQSDLGMFGVMTLSQHRRTMGGKSVCSR